MDSHTPAGLPRAVHPDLSPVDVAGPSDLEPGVPQALATGPFKVYSPGLADWEPGIDLRSEATGLTLVTPSGRHTYAAGRFTVEASPDGRILWILGDIAEAEAPQATAEAHPPVTVLMPASFADLCSRMPAVEFADPGEAAHTIHRLTAAAAAGWQARHRLGLQRPGDLALIVDPVEGEPVLGLLRVTDRGLEFRAGGSWEQDSPAERIPAFSSVVPTLRGAVARFDRLERSPSMSLSLFDRYMLFDNRFLTTVPQGSGAGGPKMDGEGRGAAAPGVTGPGGRGTDVAADRSLTAPAHGTGPVRPHEARRPAHVN